MTDSLKTHLVIRADAGPRSGMGHVMRCLALAQAGIQQNRKVIFLSALENAGLERHISNEGCDVIQSTTEPGSSEDAETLCQIAGRNGAKWIVADGYHFGSSYQKQIKDAGYNLLYIDDTSQANHYYADLVLNQNLYADTSQYQNREPYTDLLLGTEYILLRREFLEISRPQREYSEAATNILVTFGGSDQRELIMMVVKAIMTLDIPTLCMKIMVGAEYLQQYEKQLDSQGNRIEIICNSANMAEHMSWADIAVSGAGSTCWELAYMGVPALVAVIADNQIRIAGELESYGCALNLGARNRISYDIVSSMVVKLLSSYELRSDMSRRCRKLVDGGGAGRVMSRLR